MTNKKYSSVISVGVLLLAVTAGFLLRQNIYDWWRLQNYQPNQQIISLADDTTLLDDSRRLFYVQHPLIADKTEFNDYCRDNEYTIVLGCYIHGKGIYLLNVEDERLNGVEEVTAAHEFLHAAYERLSQGEKDRIGALLNQALIDANDTRLNETIEQYRKQDPSIVPNELHSIIGTEVRNISPDLENYYARYFSDRKQIVSFSERYEQAFIERRNQIRTYDDQLTVLKIKIEKLQLSLDVQGKQLESHRNEMMALKNSGQTEKYNEQVPIYNAKVQKYNQDIKTLGGYISEYNDIVQKRNSIAEEEAELVEAIDSRTAIPKQQ